MFGTFMTVIIIGYIGYYGYNIIHDLYFDKSGEIVVAAHVEEQEVDIKDELESFTQYDADEDRKIAEQKKKKAKATEEHQRRKKDQLLPKNLLYLILMRQQP